MVTRSGVSNAGLADIGSGDSCLATQESYANKTKVNQMSKNRKPIT